jgi:hypothetical protein
MVELKAIMNQIDPLLAEYNELKARARHDDLSDVDHTKTGPLGTRMSAAIERLAPAGSRYLEDVKAVHKTWSIAHSGRLNPLASTLMALKADFESGHLQSITEIVHAELFGDFLEMADHLLDQGYKDPAAVIAGSVLEEQLRKLCDKNGLSTDQGGKPKKSDSLNSDLAGASSYSKLDQKNVTAWLDLRNKAAHGKYGEYTRDQVGLLVQSIRDFITRNPA